MEAAHATLRLYMPISERSCDSPCRGPSCPSKAPLSSHQSLTPKCEEEGPAEAVRPGRADNVILTGLKEPLKALDDSSEVCWDTQLLPLCLECRAFMSMGNKQGAELKASRETPKSSGTQILRRTRRGAEGSGSPRREVKRTPKTQQVAPVCEERRLEDKKQIVCTPAARRRTVSGRDGGGRREERNLERSPEELKPAWGAEHVQNSHGQKAALSSKEEETLVDSDTELSEYDNETHLMCISRSSIDRLGGTEDMVMETVKEAAARRVLVKIEEVEEIIRRVSLISSDWIKEGRCAGEDQRRVAESESQSLNEALRTEGVRAESEPLCKQSPMNENHSTSSHSMVPNNPSSSSRKVSPVLSPPSQSSPLSLGPNQQSAPLNHSDLNQGHVAKTVEDGASPCSCGRATEVSSEAEDITRKNLASANPRLSEPDQDYLLLSGNEATITNPLQTFNLQRWTGEHR